jgi:hypothetical protein
MKTKFILFRRGPVFYAEDTATGKQTSLRTKDETEARSLLNAKNEAHRQPVLNLQLARAYLSASAPPLRNALGKPFGKPGKWALITTRRAFTRRFRCLIGNRSSRMSLNLRLCMNIGGNSTKAGETG